MVSARRFATVTILTGSAPDEGFELLGESIPVLHTIEVLDRAYATDATRNSLPLMAALRKLSCQ
ncbi:MAG: hypothetical protein ACRDKL_08590 [Solirubrobacteraceae bacterium]